ncbi:helix-turn-helix transcriptional regulator [Fictibacillus phosphorivorans]|uniref:helix-turn-helix transcriptional regulator n=1 Tax=Fictibacillus phosphorivorans TaxID=1221500 RepID=UPI001D1753A6|nr:metalloregulator ArsR/SmtB family transcription factor [Fictibacillus phosphorivorans]
MTMKNHTSTRDEIIYLLKRNKRMTVTEMAKSLGITEMAVRRHLNTLERDHVIETTLVRQAMGRPIHFYHLTASGDEQFPRNYSGLTVDFLKDIEEVSGTATIDELFKRRENRLQDRYKDRMNTLTDFEQKVNELANIQNEAGYMVDWERGEDPDTYVLTEYNCPIAKVANEYQQACSCELSLFKRMLQTDAVERKTCMAKGGDYCCYVIKEEKQTSEV